MTKKLIYLSICLGLILLASYLVFMAPYHIYSVAITEGLNSRFLKLDATTTAVLDAQMAPDLAVNRLDDDLFQTIHLSYFEIPVPINHSLFIKIPQIRVIAQTPYLGSKFLNGGGVELFSYQLEAPFRVELSEDQQKLFVLPIYKNYINKKKLEDKWQDIFSRSLGLNDDAGIIKESKRLQQQSIFELVYNLYILYNRKGFMPLETKNISFYQKKKIGIVELHQKDQRVLLERIYYLKDNTIYPVLIRTKLNDRNAMNYRARFINQIEFRESDKDSSVAIYAKYQSLKYKKRLDEDGMYYLFAAWSHDLKNKEYIKFIIYFLEKGKDNRQYLAPFYDYTFRQFGTNFSKDGDSIMETAKEGLVRKIGEDEQKELKEIEKKSKTKDEFTDENEKIFYHLNKAKESQNSQNSNESKGPKKTRDYQDSNDILYVD